MARRDLDHNWFTPGGPPVILGVGNLKPQKDFATLIRAFARVRAERPARLVILGDARGPDKDATYVAALKGLPAQLGIDKDVSFAGFAENPFAYMSRAAVFVLSSAWEGFGNVVAEALACGCPVVSTDCPSGPAEILDHGRYGPLVPVGDDAALAAAICRVLDAPLSRDELTGRAASFTVERAVDQYIELMFGSTSPTQAPIGEHSCGNGTTPRARPAIGSEGSTEEASSAKATS
jgi:glycosyltransferase involved in cell wall biosynthesis